MTAPNYTVDNLVTSVRNKYINPQSQSLFEDTDVVSLLDEELRSNIIPVINSCDSDYWITNYDQQVTGAASYTVPQRSAAGALYDVVFLDTQGNPIDMQKLSTVQIKATFPFGYQLPLYTFGYYVEDDQVFLYPQQAQNATGYKLRMKFYRRPNNLTLSTNCAQITNIASSVVTVNYIDTAWTTSTTFDVIQNFPQFISISDGLGITNIDSVNLKLTLSSVPTGLAVGMYLCPTLMTCIPQIPYETYPLLVQRGIIRMAESLGDSQGTQLAEKRYEEMKKDIINMMTPRVKKSARKIVNKNSPYSWGSMGAPFLR